MTPAHRRSKEMRSGIGSSGDRGQLLFPGLPWPCSAQFLEQIRCRHFPYLIGRATLSERFLCDMLAQIAVTLKLRLVKELVAR